MNLQSQKVLKALERAKLTGVTVRDFPQGFRLATRIHDLKFEGIEITSKRGPVSTYILVRPPLFVLDD